MDERKIIFFLPDFSLSGSNGTSVLLLELLRLVQKRYHTEIITLDGLVEEAEVSHTADGVTICRFSRRYPQAIRDYLKRTTDILVVINVCNEMAGLLDSHPGVIFVPVAHDMIDLERPVFEEMINSASGFIFMTSAERRLVSSAYDISDRPCVTGMFPYRETAHTDKYVKNVRCIDDTAQRTGEQCTEKRFKDSEIHILSAEDSSREIQGEADSATEITDTVDSMEEGTETADSCDGIQRYLLYVGRVSPQKNYLELNDFFIRYKKRNPSDLKLVVIGEPVAEGLQLLYSRDIIYKGFVSREDKLKYERNAIALINPSLYESLSIVLLEAMYVKTPVIVNGKCEVMREQCVESGAGIYYNNFEEFEKCVSALENDSDKCARMGANGSAFVRERYSDSVIEQHFDDIVGRVMNKSLNDTDNSDEKGFADKFYGEGRFSNKNVDSDGDINNASHDVCDELLCDDDVMHSMCGGSQREAESGGSQSLPSYVGILYRRFMRSIENVDQIVIVGAGNVGAHAIRAIAAAGGERIVAIADNSASVDNEFMGYHAIGIDEAVRRYPDALFVVTPIKSRDELIEQLIIKGAGRDRIEIFSLDYHEE